MKKKIQHAISGAAFIYLIFFIHQFGSYVTLTFGIICLLSYLGVTLFMKEDNTQKCE